MKKTLAIPNGSLHETTMALLAKVGIRVVASGRKFEANVEGSDLFDRAIIMKPQDMSEALIDGMIDVAIYGYDWHQEVGLGDKLTIITELNYSKKTNQPVRLVVFGRQERLIDEEGILVTTEYPRLTEQLFKRATIRFSRGGTEQKVAYGKYDYGICVVETGESIRENGLIIIKTILVSPTVLVAKENTPEIRYFGELLVGGLRAAKLRLIKMNASKEILSEILPLLPSLEAPTVNRLSNDDYAVETVVSADQVANLVVSLRDRGAKGILSQTIDIVC